MAKILISDLHSVEEKELLFTKLSDEEMAAIQGGNPAATLVGFAGAGALGGSFFGPGGTAAGFVAGAFVGAIAATIEVIATQ